MSFFQSYTIQIISTLVVLISAAIIRLVSNSLIRRYAKHASINEHRALLVIKYINFLLSTLVLVAIFLIWGVQTNQIYLAITSVLTIIGVAFFAQWSILSNITAGIILFFSFPFKIGDTIRIHDKDFPFDAEIEDIKAFHTILKTVDGEIVTYPNNLLLQKGVSIINPKTDKQEFTD